jgi:FkbM family methyltransferase
MLANIFNILIKVLSKITGKKVVYVSKQYIKPTNLAVKSIFDFWYCGNIFDQNDIAYGIANNGTVEDFDSLLVRNMLLDIKKDGNIVFYDIGANTGWYSMIAASVSKLSRVHSFEPIIEHIECFNETMNLNRYQDQCTIHESALSDTNGETEIYLAGSGSTIEKKFLDSDHELRVIKTNTLDSFTQNKNIEFPDFIKIDVEGHEYKVLLGAKNTIKSSKPILFIEIIHTLKGRTFIHQDYKRIFSFLEEMGYLSFISKNATLRKFDTSKKEEGVFMFLFLDKEKHRTIIDTYTTKP